MKTIYIILFLVLFYCPVKIYAQLEKVEVEKYYVSDFNDSTDDTDGRMLEAGSTTYRIYIDLKQGCKLKKIYGDSAHILRISSTANFYNNIDRPTAYFGYLINKSWFQNNPLLALDSWLTLGLATKTNLGVLKSEDADGSFIGGNNNSGGTAGVAGGLLINADTSAGFPLTAEDGLMPDLISYSLWNSYGFDDLSGVDTTFFGSVNSGSQFISNVAYLQENTGVSGAFPDSNKILVAQLTTKGDISFILNIEVLDSSGNSINYVATGQNNQTGDTLVSPALSYPPVCGCLDPSYLEYNSAYACSNSDSCKTKIKFGCTDTLACNFDSEANFNIPLLCCYPGYCNDRNIGVVCPSLSNGRSDLPDFSFYPNPAHEQLTLEISADKNKEIAFSILDTYGREVLMIKNNTGSGNLIQEVNIADLESGLYIIRIVSDKTFTSKMFVKE